MVWAEEPIVAEVAELKKVVFVSEMVVAVVAAAAVDE